MSLNGIASHSAISECGWSETRGGKKMLLPEAQSGHFRNCCARKAYCRLSSDMVTAARPLSSADLINRGRALSAASLMPW